MASKESINEYRNKSSERYNEIARQNYAKRMEDPAARAHWNETCRVNSKKWREKKKKEKQEAKKNPPKQEGKTNEKIEKPPPSISNVVSFE